MEPLKDRIKHMEGFRLFPYKDSLGYWTVGFGHKMNNIGLSILSKGITNEEAEHLLDVDLEISKRGMLRLPNAVLCNCNELRKEVLICMVFQLGLAGVIKFKKMLAALEIGDYEKAADEMLDSKWNSQTPERCWQLSMLMRDGDG